MDTEQRIEKLEREMREHYHNGVVGRQILLPDITGTFKTVSSVPAQIPKTAYDQVQIYVNGATYRLYWYDTVAGVWHYVTATA